MRNEYYAKTFYQYRFNDTHMEELDSRLTASNVFRMVYTIN